MMGKSHLVLGAALAVTSAALLPLDSTEQATWIAVATVTSLWPDLDGRKATLSRYLPFISWPLRKLAALVYSLTATPLDGKQETGVHRRLTHIPAFIIPCGIILGALTTPVIGGAFIAGNFFHLLGDAPSLSGLPWLAPFKYKGKRWYDFKVPKRFRFRVGGQVELMILRPACYVLLVLSIAFFSYSEVIPT